jgi:hypothetical protein
MALYANGFFGIVRTMKAEERDYSDFGDGLTYLIKVLPFAGIALAYNIGLGIWSSRRRGTEEAKPAALLSVTGIVLWVAVWLVLRGMT